MLIVNVGSGAPAGGSGCQYFVGVFDGKGFTLDPSFPKPQPEHVPNGKVIADFDRLTAGNVVPHLPPEFRGVPRANIEFLPIQDAWFSGSMNYLGRARRSAE